MSEPVEIGGPVATNRRGADAKKAWLEGTPHLLRTFDSRPLPHHLFPESLHVSSCRVTILPSRVRRSQVLVRASGGFRGHPGSGGALRFRLYWGRVSDMRGIPQDRRLRAHFSTMISGVVVDRKETAALFCRGRW